MFRVLKSWKPRFVMGLCAGGIALGLNGGIADAQAPSVQLSSTQQDLQAELKAASLLFGAILNDGVTSAELLAAAQSDYQRLLSVLYEAAYYGATISIKVNGKEAADYSPFERIGTVQSIVVTVNEGDRFQFGDVSIAPRPDGHGVIPAFTKGSTANSSVISEAVEDVIEAWREDGRPTAQVAQQSIVADHPQGELDAAIRIAPGARATFGQVRVIGNQRMRTNRILKIAGLTPGEKYHPATIAAAADRLRRTGIFSTVALAEAKHVNGDGTLDITATMVEAKLRRVGAGASWSTTEGATLEGFWLHRNLLGGGERLRIDGEISGLGGETEGRDLSFGLRLTRPATLRPDTDASFILNYESDQEPDYRLTSYTVGGELERQFSKNLSGKVSLQYRDIDTNDSFGIRNFRLLELPLGLTFDGRDSVVQPTRGYFASLSATPFLDSDRSLGGARFTLDGRMYHDIGNDFVLAGRVQLGSVVGPEIAQATPDYLFYSGGGGSVRGHDYQSLGVDQGNDTKSGGKSFVGLSAEVRFPIRSIVGGVVFADYGYIGSESNLGQSGDSHAGYGFGVRIETGLGPLRIDVATPSGSSVSLQNMNLYIGIGQAF